MKTRLVWAIGILIALLVTVLSVLSGAANGAERNFNLQISPVAFTTSRPNGSFSFGVAERMAIAIKGTHMSEAYHNGLEHDDGYEVGARAEIYLSDSRYEHGWLLRPGLFYANFLRGDYFGDVLNSAFATGVSDRTKVNGPMIEILAGYQWVFGSGFNMDVNFGMETYHERYYRLNSTSRTVNEYKSAKQVVDPVIEFNLGMAF